MKDSDKVDDKILRKWWWHKYDSSDSMTEVFPVRTSDDATVGLCGSATLCITDSSRVGK